jgi:hypothetical protein
VIAGEVLRADHAHAVEALRDGRWSRSG